MKKIIAVLMGIVMMLSGCAFAAGIEVSVDSITLIKNNAVVMQMDDPGLRLAFAEGDDGLGLRAALEADGRTALEAVVTLGAERVFAKLTGISDVYSINLESLKALARTARGFIGSAGIEPTEADMAVVGEMIAIAAAAVENGIYYSEDGATVGVIFSDGDIRALIDKAMELVGNHPEILEQAGLSADELYDEIIPEDMEFTLDASLSYTETGMAAQLVLYVAQSDFNGAIALNAQTDMASYISLTGAVIEDEATLMEGNIVVGFEADDGAWLIPSDTASVDVMTMDETRLEKLMTEFRAILSMFGL